MEIVSAEAPAEGLETSLGASGSNTQSPMVPHVDEHHDRGLAAISTRLELQNSFADGDPNASDDYEPPEPFTDGRAEVDEVSFDSAPVEIANDSDIQTGLELHNSSESMTISTGSDSNHYSANEQRMEMVGTSREVHLVYPCSIGIFLTISKAADNTVPTSQSSFAPYESPLRYFHAFRFHPKYSDGVSGGLKSLTYSNRIDHNKEMCPDEWEGNDCPRGEACQFQHFQNIVAPGESTSFG